MKNLKYYIYPTVLFLVLIVLSTFNIHGSSIGLFKDITEDNNYSNNILFAKPRAIRSDEYLVSTPTMISQILNNNSTINPDIGDGENLGTHYNMPTDNIFTFFKPAVWIFFITDNIEFSFAFFWWIRIVFFLIATYVLFLEITNKNIFLSITGSLLFYFTPFIQWWLAVDTITPIAFGIFLFIRLVKENILWKEILLGIGLTYFIISFAIIAYPPFQVPLVWITLSIAFSYIVSNWKLITLKKNKLLKLASILVAAAIITGLFLLLYFKMFEDVTTAMMGTSYPGERFIHAGSGNIYALLDGFYNILMQKDSNGAPFANQSEASNFFALYPFLFVWTLYKIIVDYFKTKKIDWIAIGILLPFIIFSAWCFLPLPDFISKITGFYLAPPQRLYIGFGFAGYLLIFYILSKKNYFLNIKNKQEILIVILLAIISSITYYLTGKYLYAQRPESFIWPTIISPNLKILGVTLLVPIILFLITWGKKLGIIILLTYAVISTIYINPLYRGLDVIINTDMAKYMQEVSKDNESAWIAYGDHHYAQYLLANGNRAINGIHMYPQFKIWSTLDPEKEYYNIYNRYAHIIVSDKNPNSQLVSLIQNDAILLSISPCDEKLKNLGVKYVLSTINLQNTSCLIKQKTFGDAVIYTIQEN